MGDSPSESGENTTTQSRENNPNVMEDTEPRTENSDRKKDDEEEETVASKESALRHSLKRQSFSGIYQSRY